MPFHADYTDADLHVPGYRQSSDPGAVGAGKDWLDTSTSPPTLKRRNATNTGWDTPLSGGGPPTGSAGGDLTGTYPNPTIGTNKVTVGQMAQAAAKTVLGNPTASTANVQATTDPVVSGSITGANIIVTGLTGATAASRYVGATTSGAPASGTFAIGDFIIDRSGFVWICTVAGSPGTWTQVGGGGAATFVGVGARFTAPYSSVPDNSLVAIPMSSTVYDTDGFWNIAVNSGQSFTVPSGKNGRYLMGACVNPSYVASSNVYIQLTDNASNNYCGQHTWMDTVENAGSFYVCCSIVADLAVGDKVFLYIYHTHGSTSDIYNGSASGPSFWMHKIN